MRREPVGWPKTSSRWKEQASRGRWKLPTQQVPQIGNRDRAAQAAARRRRPEVGCRRGRSRKAVLHPSRLMIPWRRRHQAMTKLDEARVYYAKDLIAIENASLKRSLELAGWAEPSKFRRVEIGIEQLGTVLDNLGNFGAPFFLF